MPSITNYLLNVYHAKQGKCKIKLSVQENLAQDNYCLSCHLPASTKAITVEASDCFNALQQIRQQAEREAWHICCQGSRLNVYPSGMTRQMTGGIVAYVLTLGRQAEQNNTVNIFDAIEPSDYATVKEQKAFVDAWFRSLS